MKYYKAAELEIMLFKGETLNLHDYVNITGFNYLVEDSYLSKTGYGSDSSIFSYLILNMIEFCKKHYGYDPVVRNTFPHYKKGDFLTATRLVIALMKRAEKGRWFYSRLYKLRLFFK